jgi:hypothetical protein
MSVKTVVTHSAGHIQGSQLLDIPSLVFGSKVNDQEHMCPSMSYV